jgi:PAS domain S-box-containing protein
MDDTFPPGSGREEDQLESCAATDALDPTQEPDFDRLVRLAARVFGVPLAATSIDCRDLQSFQVRVGFDAATLDFSALCSPCLTGSDGVFMTLDATRDPRFAAVPGAGDAPQIGFFAGVMLHSPTGERLGELCILEHAPRKNLSERDRHTLLDFAAITIDQIERRRLAIAERASQSRFDNIASTSPDGIICTDHLGTITFWNTAAENLFGYKASEVIGHNMRIIVPERFRNAEGEVAQIAGAESPGVIGSTISLIARRRDGSEFPIELSLSQWQPKRMETAGQSSTNLCQKPVKDHCVNYFHLASSGH